MLVTTPLVVSIKRAIPEAAIDYLVFEGTEGVLVNNPLIRRVITVPRKGSNAGVLLSLFRSYDVAVAAYPSDRTAIAAAVAGKRSICLTYDTGMLWKKIVLEACRPCDDRFHVVANIQSLLPPLGIPPVPCVATGYDDRDHYLAYARAVMPEGKYMVLHPYSRNRSKYWPAKSWGELAGLILDKTNCLPLFTRTPDPLDSGYLDQILAAAPEGVAAFDEPCSLSRLATAIKGSAAFVGIDTAVTHVAAAVDVPTIAIFGPTLTRYWAPWPNGCSEHSPFSDNKGIQRKGNVTVVQKDWECVPCNRESCAVSTRGVMECLEQLTPEEVFAEVLRYCSHA